MRGGQRVRLPLRPDRNARLASFLSEHRGTRALCSVRGRLAVYTRLAGSVAGWISHSWGVTAAHSRAVRMWYDNAEAILFPAHRVTDRPQMPQARRSCG